MRDCVCRDCVCRDCVCRDCVCKDCLERPEFVFVGRQDNALVMTIVMDS